jgi:pimeloyl-ACP methyl ester carboxylesterase
MKRFTAFILVFSILSLACQTLTNPQLQPPTAGPTKTIIAQTQAPTVSSIPPTQTPVMIQDMKGKLKELGGAPCKRIPLFTCVTITVPLNHFDPANPETIDVVFAVAPARGERKGMYVQAFPGGPGGEGVSYASVNNFSPAIKEQYDIVFFDQRGLGLSNPLECKNAYASYFLNFLNTDDSIGEEGYDTPQEQKTAIQNAKSFVDECVTEIGIDPAKLKYFVTNQVAEDIESFRQAIGDDKFMLYGVSYGTSVAQTYARAHADRLLGLILDGTQDTTLTGNEIAFSQMDAINEVLLEVFKACDADSDCSQGLEGGSQAAYDELAQKLADAPIAYDYPFSNGTKVKRFFTFRMLDFTVSYQMYGPEDRMDFMRALASAKAGDMLPLVRLYYDKAYIDGRTEKYRGDSSFSDTMYFIVWCSDDAYYSGTSEERSARLMQEGEKLVGLIPRLELDVFMLGLTCAFWPSAPTSPAVIQPLRAVGVPTFVLDATLDPATPFHEGKTVFEHLDKGYFLYVEGGPHGILGRGFRCPDKYIEAFLISGTLPEQRETRCDWGNAVIQ